VSGGAGVGSPTAGQRAARGRAAGLSHSPPRRPPARVTVYIRAAEGKGLTPIGWQLDGINDGKLPREWELPAALPSPEPAKPKRHGKGVIG
jgi:hypothetical protein